jgi:hypothetical protein
MTTISSKESKACCDRLHVEDARRAAERAIHRSSARKVGWLKTIARQTSNTLDSVKNLLQDPEMHVEGPPAIKACAVPWTRCCSHPSPVESCISLERIISSTY